MIKRKRWKPVDKEEKQNSTRNSTKKSFEREKESSHFGPGRLHIDHQYDCILLMDSASAFSLYTIGMRCLLNYKTCKPLFFTLTWVEEPKTPITINLAKEAMLLQCPAMRHTLRVSSKTSVKRLQNWLELSSNQVRLIWTSIVIGSAITLLSIYILTLHN
jgi:hypothetical protein